ncbi:armadillo repeat-containing protein 8, partial [Dorcoceras hygrometricum]
EVFDFAINALSHDSAEVRNLSAGHFMNENVVLPLVQLLCDSCMSVQISALREISNVAVDFKPHKSLFTQSKGVSMEPAIRNNDVCALKNLMFLANNWKEEIILEFTMSTLSSVTSDPEAAIQEQALALIHNLISGTLNSIEYVFGEYVFFSWTLLLQVLVVAACKFSLANS